MDPVTTDGFWLDAGIGGTYGLGIGGLLAGPQGAVVVGASGAVAGGVLTGISTDTPILSDSFTIEIRQTG
jgi:outer membrane lipoprotein SlyB